MLSKEGSVRKRQVWEKGKTARRKGERERKSRFERKETKAKRAGEKRRGRSLELRQRGERQKPAASGWE